MKNFIFVVTLFLLLASCGNDPYRVDVSGVEVQDVKIRRFDKDVFGTDTAGIDAAMKKLEDTYGSFYSGFCSIILLFDGTVPDSLLRSKFLSFVSHPDMKEVFEASQKAYPDLSELESEIRDVFRHWKYYFPVTDRFPGVYAMVSGLNLPMSSSDSAIGIGLDMYLGKDHPIYEMAAFEKYRRKNMNSYNILPDFIRAMSMTVFPPSGKENDLLSEIIYQGKIQFMIDLLAPHLADSLKMGYSGEQLNWCLANESNIWSFLVKDKLIFTITL